MTIPNFTAGILRDWNWCVPRVRYPKRYSRKQRKLFRVKYAGANWWRDPHALILAMKAFDVVGVPLGKPDIGCSLAEMYWIANYASRPPIQDPIP